MKLFKILKNQQKNNIVNLSQKKLNTKYISHNNNSFKKKIIITIMKRIEVYLRPYKWEDRKGNHGHIEIVKNPEDNIDEKLSQICFVTGCDISSTTRSLIRQKYLYFQKKN